MSGPFDHVCARCRLAGEKLFLKGEKCFTPKCPMVRRPYAPGAHGQSRRGAPTEYGKQLKQKQALRAMYGLRERQLHALFTKAKKERGITADALMRMLESRLDNVVFRLGVGVSRPHARQLVHHGLVTVDGRRVTIPAYRVRPGQVIAVKVSKRGGAGFVELEERTRTQVLPAWLERADAWSGKVLRDPALEPHEVPVDLRAVVEFYSR